MEDSIKKIKTVKSVTLAKKIKTIKPVTLAKNIVSVPIKSISTSISILVKSVCDSILAEPNLVKSIEFVESVKNSFNMIADFAYFLFLNVFISPLKKKPNPLTWGLMMNLK